MKLRREGTSGRRLRDGKERETEEEDGDGDDEQRHGVERGNLTPLRKGRQNVREEKIVFVRGSDRRGKCGTL